jgi:hypothetical protein
MIISILNKDSGFFSQFFFTLNHYLYCKKYNLNFKINSEKWLFKSNNGWCDYFKEILLNYNNDFLENYYSYPNIIEEFKIIDYKNIINEVYIYNENTQNEIITKKKELNIIDNNYDSIFIRRGDKLINESEYINGEEYLKILLVKNPNCNKIFLQTDDYNSYLELKKYINQNNLNIELLTLCDENTKGFVIFNEHLKIINENNINNYLLNNKEIKNTEPIDLLDNNKIFKHTLDMIIGIDIVLKSNICILDYQSNVSRFIKLAHNNSNNVYDLRNIDLDINYNKYICPSYGHSFNNN